MYHHSCINSPIRFTGEAVPIFYHHFSNIDVSCLHLLPKSCHHPFHHVGFMTEGFCETRAQQKQALPNVFVFYAGQLRLLFGRVRKGGFLWSITFVIYPVIRDSSFKRHMLSWCHTGPTPFSPTFKPERLMRYQPWEPDWTANVYINPTLTNLRVSQRISQGCPLKVVQFVNFVDFQFFIQQRSARSSSFDAKAEMFWSVAGWCYQSTGMCNEATVQTNGYMFYYPRFICFTIPEMEIVDIWYVGW